MSCDRSAGSAAPPQNLRACGATEFVPFPGVALFKSSEGWGCGIRLFAKCAKNGAPSLSGGVG
jgi:hypothetical protein